MNTTEKTIQDLIVTRNACGSRIVLDGKSCIAPIDDKAFFDKYNNSGKIDLHDVQR